MVMKSSYLSKLPLKKNFNKLFLNSSTKAKHNFEIYYPWIKRAISSSNVHRLLICTQIEIEIELKKEVLKTNIWYC